MSIFKACDIRAPYPDELQDHHAIALGRAIVRLQGPGEVVVAGDGRISTPKLKQLLINSLLASGAQVIDLGVVPTPVFYYARHHLGIKTGVMVTASHNPPQYNGFKLALSDLPITEMEMNLLRKIMESTDIRLTNSVGEKIDVDILPDYLAFAQSQISSCSNLRIVVDYGNGMAALTGPRLWNHCGAEIIPLFDVIDGHFSNRSPNPAVPQHLTALALAVQKHHAHLGVAYDGDADRMAIVDEQGRFVPTDKVIALFARHLLQNTPAPVVYDQKCSRLVPEIIRDSGGEPIMEKSGHTFIKTTFLKETAIYAGELSGHHFFRALPQGDDGVMASIYFAEMLVQSGLPLSELWQSLPSYPNTPDIRLPMSSKQADAVLEQLTQAFADIGKLSFLDGVRVELADSWGLARKSVTEPLLTLRFEGEDRNALRKIIANFENAAPTLAGRLPQVQR